MRDTIAALRGSPRDRDRVGEWAGAVLTGVTVMAGLNCGTVSSSAWPVLRAGCDAAVAVADEEALRAVADLEALGVCSVPSGAATLAGVRAALTHPERRAALGVGGDGVLVLVSTEGRSP